MNRELLGSLLGVSMILPGALQAQGTGDQSRGDATELQEVVVTGSLIKREESSQLVTTVNSTELAERGATNALDILSAIAQNQTLSTSSDGVREGGLTNLANLRTLGPENTLVLINGRRMVNNPIFDNGVDLNTVPTALLESVDVLADGASSIYGSDAVAGVINFRMRRDFEGIEYSGHALVPSAAGGDVRNASIAGGIGSLQDNGWNFVAGVTWREQDRIRSLDRPYSATSDRRSRGVNLLLGQPFPSNVSQPATPGFGVRNPYPCTPPALVPLSTGGCALDPDAIGQIDIQNPEEQISLYSRYTQQLGEHQLSVEYIRAKSEISNALSGARVINLAMPNTNPFYPGRGVTPAITGLNTALPIFVTSRFTPGGRRTTQNETSTNRLLLELEGQVGKFDYNLWALRSEATTDLNTLDGALLRQGVVDGLAGTNGAPYINPFGDQSAAGAAYIESIKVRTALATGEAKIEMAGATLSGSIFDMPAGPVSAALAIESAREEMRYTVAGINSLLVGNDLGNGVAATGKRTRSSVTAELLVPLVDRLDANLSGRWDDYSDFGNTINPKLLLNFAATETFSLHASYSKGFRAPPLPKLYAPQSLGTVPGAFQNDPVLCPGGVVNTAAGGIAARDCQTAFSALRGGNPNLDPQRSTTYSAGFDVRFDESLAGGSVNLGLDYWSYRLTDTIGTVAPNAIFADATTFAAYFVRCQAADPAFTPGTLTCNFPGGTGNPIAYVLNINANVGQTETSGIDLAASWSTETSIGTLAIDYRGTYVTKYDFQRIPGTPIVSRAGVVLDGFPAIKYNHYLTLGWQKGPWATTLQNRHTGSYDDCNANCGVPAALFNSGVGSYSLWNLTAAYTFDERWTAMLHVNNMFDRDPPFTNNNVSNCAGCDLRFIDPTGRAVGISIRGKLDRKR
jgi:iron complex outermembrane recepter protein